MKNTISSIVKEFIKVVIIVAIAVPTIALFAAWTGPTGAPPTNNADAPVNVSNNPQEKKGDLSIHRTEGGFDVGMFAADKLKILGGAIFNNNSPTDDKKIIINADGNVGIGTVSPTAKLDVAGKILIKDDASAPINGMIRHTGADFEGRVGDEWKSLTKSIGLLVERIRGNATITYRDYGGDHESCGISFSSSLCNWAGIFGQNNHWDDDLCKNAFEHVWKNQNPCDAINILRVGWNLSGNGGPVDVEFIRR